MTDAALIGPGAPRSLTPDADDRFGRRLAAALRAVIDRLAAWQPAVPAEFFRHPFP